MHQFNVSGIQCECHCVNIYVCVLSSFKSTVCPGNETMMTGRSLAARSSSLGSLLWLLLILMFTLMFILRIVSGSWSVPPILQGGSTPSEDTLLADNGIVMLRGELQRQQESSLLQSRWKPQRSDLIIMAVV